MMKKLLTCTKRYSDFPAAHRQPKHDGHCALVHGHNWSFEFEFIADATDECGFVIDFGKLQWLKGWLAEKFDHTLLLNSDDPLLEKISVGLESFGINNVVVVPDCSCEGLANYIGTHVNQLLRERGGIRPVAVKRVTVFEDSKNSATVDAVVA